MPLGNLVIRSGCISQVVRDATAGNVLTHFHVIGGPWPELRDVGYEGREGAVKGPCGGEKRKEPGGRLEFLTSGEVGGLGVERAELSNPLWAFCL